MPEFFQTIMGQRFYESTMPRIAKALERLADAAEAQAAPAPAPAKPEETNTIGVGKIIELSNAHVTLDTARILDDMAETRDSFRLPDTSGNDAYIAVYPRDEFGWFLSIPAEPLGVVPPIVNDDGCVRVVAGVVRYAQSKGCSWVLLDRDADKTEDLPTYEW